MPQLIYQKTTLKAGFGLQLDGDTINASLLSGEIRNADIHPQAKIEVSKTLLNVDTSQLTLVDNKISVNDIYIRNTGDTMVGNFNVNNGNN